MVGGPALEFCPERESLILGHEPDLVALAIASAQERRFPDREVSRAQRTGLHKPTIEWTDLA
jgi:hypothetical protein